MELTYNQICIDVQEQARRERSRCSQHESKVIISQIATRKRGESLELRLQEHRVDEFIARFKGG